MITDKKKKAMKRSTLLSLLLLGSTAAMADGVAISGRCNDGAMSGMQLYLNSFGNTSKEATARLTLNADGTFSGEAVASPFGFYYLYGASQTAQSLVPLYLPGDLAKYNISVDMVDGMPQATFDADNRALSAYNAVTRRKGGEVMQAADYDADRLMTFFREYTSLADSIAEADNCSAEVRHYLKIWSYTTAFSNCEQLNYMSRRTKHQPAAVQSADFLESPKALLDDDLASCFPVAIQILNRSLPKGSLEQRLQYVADSIGSQRMSGRLQEYVLGSYVQTFDYANHYDEGLQELEAATKRFGLSAEWVNRFKVRRSSLAGNPFPKDVVLEDINGNTVDFGRFKGKWVYIDMWASWCAPCRKEIPHLQALEKEIDGANDVVFVSISIDTNRDAWLKAVDNLGLSGNQLHDKNGKLGEELNVSGIPFFAIYSPKGELHVYNAPRPSTGDQIKSLLLGLKQ
jgi:thiol-disulfide isomerase/thioredoxin